MSPEMKIYFAHALLDFPITAIVLETKTNENCALKWIYFHAGPIVLMFVTLRKKNRIVMLF